MIVNINSLTKTVTSKDVADNFSKTHQHVMDAIRSMDCSPEFRATNFRVSYYLSKQNKKLKCYEITRDGFSFLGMGFKGKRAGKWKEAYLEAFNKMESYIEKQAKDESMLDSINRLSGQLDDLAAAGSVWGQTGHEIRKKKKEATQELAVLMNKAQLQLGF